MFKYLYQHTANNAKKTVDITNIDEYMYIVCTTFIWPSVYLQK